ncbi:hypothetical protein [Streptomyces sp. A1136]|nr:hypothetical protein [Streptomyces sp. A1136]
MFRWTHLGDQFNRHVSAEVDRAVTVASVAAAARRMDRTKDAVRKARAKS